MAGQPADRVDPHCCPCNCIHTPLNSTLQSPSNTRHSDWTIDLLGTGLLLKLVKIPVEIILRVGMFWILLGLINWIETRLKIKDPKINSLTC